jgi:hypothetical protein
MRANVARALLPAKCRQLNRRMGLGTKPHFSQRTREMGHPLSVTLNRPPASHLKTQSLHPTAQTPPLGV